MKKNCYRDFLYGVSKMGILLYKLSVLVVVIKYGGR